MREVTESADFWEGPCTLQGAYELTSKKLSSFLQHCINNLALIKLKKILSNATKYQTVYK